MVRIHTKRFVLRELSEDDASERYLSWFRDETTQAYVAATSEDVDGLRQYIRQRAGREDVLFLGIFDRTSGLHVGNVKYEPVNRDEHYAIMGILIGDPAFRGIGVASEVLASSGKWLRDNRGIRHIGLGVHRDNQAAIRAYERVGFRAASAAFLQQSDPVQVTMVWSL